MHTESSQAVESNHTASDPVQQPHTENGSTQAAQQQPSSVHTAAYPQVIDEAGRLEHSTAAATSVVNGSGTPDSRAAQGRGSNASGGRGRQSGNHLLNFQYQHPGRGGSRAAGGSQGRGGGTGNRRRGLPQARPQKYDRNKFLQANYRFLVSDGVDDQLFHGDADRMFDWEDVLQVELLSGAPVQCPISLDSPPICPQITPCGHIFSFHAIMQHLVYHGGPQLKRWAPCPLCFEPVVARDLRMLLITPVLQPKVGEPITMQLLKRGRTTIIPQPVGQPCCSNAAAGNSNGHSAISHSEDTVAEPASKQTSRPMTDQPKPAGNKTGGAARTKVAAAVLEPSQAPTDAALNVHPLAVNRWAKFAVVSEEGALPLLQNEGRQLADYAAEVTSEGTSDAAMIAPYIFMAMDALAARAQRWAQHREEQLMHRGTSSTQQPERSAAAAVDRSSSTAMDRGTRNTAPPMAVTVAGQLVTASVADTSARASASLVPPATGPGAQQESSASLEAMNLHAAYGGKLPEQEVTLPSACSGETGGAEVAALGAGSASSGDGVAATGAWAAAGAAGEAASMQASHNAAARAMDIPVPSSKRPPSSSGGELLLGHSPPTSTLTAVNYSNTSGDFYMYQAVDGQWVFLDPFCVRVMLAHYGSYEACPATISGMRLVELDHLVQTEATRKRWKFLSHLPLTGTFLFAEVDLSTLLPPSALAPFAEELAVREKRRQRAKREERRHAASEAAAARAAAAARRGPSAKELAAMPALSTAAAALAAGPQPTLADMEALAAARALGFASADELSESLALQAAADARSSPPSAAPPGVSFSSIAKLGFAATGPALLGSSPPTGQLVGSAGTSRAASAVPQGAWANKPVTAAVKPAGQGGSGASTSTGRLQTTWGFSLPSASNDGVASSKSSTITTPAGASASWSSTSAAAAAVMAGIASSPAQQAASSSTSGAAGGGSSATSAPGKKSGKGKGTLLFASSAARRY